MKKYDITVIGLGPAGLSVSSLANSIGLKVLAVEANRVGGECLNYGCIPSKSVLKAAEINETLKHLKRFGLELDGKVEAKDILGIIRNKIKYVGDTKAVKMLDGVDILLGKGNATFVDSHTIRVGNNNYYSDTIFICTGSKPFIPQIEGINGIPYLTNRNLFEERKIPETLTVIGGGAIACEMAEAFFRLGSKVSIVNMDSHLIPIVDRDISESLEKIFRDAGIEIHNNTTAYKLCLQGNKTKIYTKEKIFLSDKILVAAGRQPVIHNLNLDRININYNQKGIIVDEFNRTNLKHIYAIGDCNGQYTFSHAAMHQGMLSIMHLLNMKFGVSLKRDDYLVPWTIFTDPEIAHVGITEEEAIEKGIDHIIVKDYYKNYGRTVVDGKSDGFIKLITNTGGKIHGVSIIGNRAGELINEWTIAMQHNLTVKDIAMLQHPFPSLSLMNSRVSQNWLMQSIKSKKFIERSIA